MLPLSHDEVVHLKGSLLGKMPGDQWQRFANLRALYAWMWSHPGKQLLFMGAELAQEREWSHDREIDWFLLDDPLHRGVRDLLRELNRVEADRPALWSLDTLAGGLRAGSTPTTATNSVYAFLRIGGRRGRARRGGLRRQPHAGAPPRLPARPAARAGAGSTCSTPTTSGGAAAAWSSPRSTTDGTPWQGQPDSAVLTLPPLAVRWLVPADGLRGRDDAGGCPHDVRVARRPAAPGRPGAGAAGGRGAHPGPRHHRQPHRLRAARAGGRSSSGRSRGLRRPKWTTLGSELAGDVDGGGDAVTKFAVGDRGLRRQRPTASVPMPSWSACGRRTARPRCRTACRYEEAAATRDGFVLALTCLRQCRRRRRGSGSWSTGRPAPSAPRRCSSPGTWART